MRRSLPIALKAVFAAGTLWLLLHWVPVADIREALHTANPVWFAVGVAIQFASRALATVHMKVITDSQGLALDRRTLFRILLSVQFYSLFLPGTLAGGGVAWLKYVEHGAGSAAAAAAVVLNRALGMLVLLALGAGAVLLDPAAARLPPAVGAGLAAVGLVCIAVIWMPWRTELAERIAGCGRVGRGAGALLERLLRFHRLPVAGRLAVVTNLVAFHLGGAAAVWSFARAVGAPVDFVSVIWIHAALQATLLLPISIAGIGIRDASLAGLGLLVGVAAPTSVAWSLTILAGLVLVTAVGGLLESGALVRGLTRGSRGTTPHPSRQPPP